MRSATGRWVTGADFHGREAELRVLERRVRDGNHILLTGQRRMGKTSLARELGRRLADDGWISIFADVEHAAGAEDAIAELARAAHPARPIVARLADGMGRWMRETVEELSAGDFGVKFRAELNAGNWRRFGDDLFAACSGNARPVFLFIDELPVFLSRLVREPEGARRVDEFLSWMRHALQILETGSPVAILSGSIGFAPVVARLGIPDRINHLDPFRLGPWDRDTAISCFRRLAESNGLNAEEEVPGAVHDALGLGIPHFVQWYFARLSDVSAMRAGAAVTAADVEEVYRTGLLGSSGHGDLMHYETRLRDALDDDALYLAMEILAETAVRGVLSPDALRSLERIHGSRLGGAPERIREVLGVLEHDGYLEHSLEGHRSSPFRPLRDWWAVRFRGHHTPLAGRYPNSGRGEPR